MVAISLLLNKEIVAMLVPSRIEFYFYANSLFWFGFKTTDKLCLDLKLSVAFSWFLKLLSIDPLYCVTFVFGTSRIELFFYAKSLFWFCFGDKCI